MPFASSRILLRRAGPALALLLAAGAAGAAEAPADTSMALEGAREETVFRSLTVEGENRIRIDFERPALQVDLDPSAAPGLSWGTPRDVLDRTVPDLITPFLAVSAHAPSPYAPRPWLQAYRRGPVASFTTDLDDVASWRLQVVDSRGREVVTLAGEDDPPRMIPWDGRDTEGEPVPPGLTYSFMLETFDKAGNKRHFTGDGFGLEAYRLDGPAGPLFLASGEQWRTAGAAGAPSALLLEAASALDLALSPAAVVEVRATARSFGEAEALGGRVADALGDLLAGGRVRVRVTTLVETGAPAGGTLRIGPATS